jgi:hypothetical protein
MTDPVAFGGGCVVVGRADGSGTWAAAGTARPANSAAKASWW